VPSVSIIVRGTEGRSAPAEKAEKRTRVLPGLDATEDAMTSRKLTLASAALAVLAAAASAPVRADEPTIWLRIDVNQADEDHAKVKINVPLSLMEVVIESVDTSKVMSDLKTEKGIDIGKLWRQMRKMELDEFITVDTDDAKVKVYKDKDFFRLTIQEESYDKPNCEIKIPLPIMDYLFEDHKNGFKMSDLVDTLRGHLPLTLVEATHEKGTVKVWMEEH
jgi:hypothetical protein